MTDHSAVELAKAKVNMETSLIFWRELQRFFAAGLAVSVSESLDLVEVAYQFSSDNIPVVQDWLVSQRIAPVSDLQAQDWYENDTEVWAVVIKPWVLVQASSPPKNQINL